MNELSTKINDSADLKSVEIRATDGTVFPGSSPVLATPAAFLGAVLSEMTGAQNGVGHRVTFRPQHCDGIMSRAVAPLSIPRKGDPRRSSPSCSPR